MLALVAGLWLPGIAQALDTATELRLRSIEARLPDADRLEDLERKVNRLSSAGGDASSAAPAGGGGSFSLLQDIQSLQEEVRGMRGEIEELKHQIRQNEQGQKALFQNLDERLQALEQNGGVAAASGTGADSGGSSRQAAASAVDQGAAEQAYTAAFGLLKEGKYGESRKALARFVEDYPDSSYSDNAYYWLGEAHYVDRQYDQALTAFRKVIQDYPDSGKAGGALYKVGVIQDEQGDTAAAQATLINVVEKYPEDNAAELARKRLKAMSGNGGA